MHIIPLTTCISLQYIDDMLSQNMYPHAAWDDIICEMPKTGVTINLE